MWISGEGIGYYLVRSTRTRCLPIISGFLSLIVFALATSPMQLVLYLVFSSALSLLVVVFELLTRLLNFFSFNFRNDSLLVNALNQSVMIAFPACHVRHFTVL